MLYKEHHQYSLKAERKLRMEHDLHQETSKTFICYIEFPYYHII